MISKQLKRKVLMEINNMNIEKAIQAVIEVEVENDFIDKFAREAYNEKIKEVKFRQVTYGTYHAYKRYSIISANEIKVHYEYGGGDREYDGDFIVKI